MCQQIKELEKAGSREDDKISTLKTDTAALEAEARDLNAKTQAIEDAVYDLKAVNPHVRADEDTRTSEDLIRREETAGGVEIVDGRPRRQPTADRGVHSREVV